jgi:hypothetical protein
MKPQEILDKYKLGSNYCWREAQSTTQSSLYPYLNQDCVIAHLNETIGFCFIIKTRKKFMAFYGVQQGVYFGGQGYMFKRCSLKEAINLIKDNGTILNQFEYDKMKDSILLESLE